MYTSLSLTYLYNLRLVKPDALALPSHIVFELSRELDFSINTATNFVNGREFNELERKIILSAYRLSEGIPLQFLPVG